MNHTFIAVISFLLALSSLQGITLATPASNSAKFRQLYEAVTENGQIILQKDDIGFFVNVDFAYNPDDASDSDAYDSDIGAMSLGLYTSQTILSQSCLQFYEYECSQFSCSAYTQKAKVDLPYFVAEGHYAEAPVYLDYSNWELNNYAVIATTCTGNPYYPYGSSRYGIVGLGFNTSQSNFIGGTTFSITLQRDASSGILLFDSNTNVTESESATFVASLSASSNWHIDASDTTITIEDSIIDFSGKIIFDLDATEIGFPSSIYQIIIDSIQTANPELGGCTNEYYLPSCGYNGKIKHLKTIKLTVQGQEIKIPPTVYVQGCTDGDAEIDSTITLNIRALDNTYSDYSYVAENYANYIILDQNFLAYYYAEFEANDDEYTVTLQTLYGKHESSDWPVWAYIVAGIGGFFVLSLFTCCICGCIKRRRDRRRAACKKVFQTGPVVNSSDQVSLVNNDQVADGNVNYPAQNNYYYPPPTYSYNQNGNYQYPQQFQQPTHAYGNMPGYTYIPQTGTYPYLPPGQGTGQAQLPYGQSNQGNQ